MWDGVRSGPPEGAPRREEQGRKEGDDEEHHGEVDEDHQQLLPEERRVVGETVGVRLSGKAGDRAFFLVRQAEGGRRDAGAADQEEVQAMSARKSGGRMATWSRRTG